MIMRHYLTISNLLSISRIFLIIPIGYCLIADFPYHRLWTVGIILIAIATDFLDGYLARKLHQVTDIGKIIDPLADKIAIGGYAILLAWIGELPVWYLVIILLRDILIFSGGLYIRHKKRIIPQSNMLGKIAVNLIAFVLLLATIRIDALEKLLTYTMWLSIAVMIYSVWIYSKRLFIGRNIDIVK